jgi:hypothetical protein
MGKRADISSALLNTQGGELQDLAESVVTLTDNNTLSGVNTFSYGTGGIVSPNICHMGFVENTTAFVANDTSNVTWVQPAGTILKNIYIFVVLQPTITVNAACDLGYIVGTEDGNGDYVAAATDQLIDGAANTTALKTGAFLHVATRDIGDLGVSGPVARLLPVPDTSDDTTLVADGNYTAADKDIVFGTSATNHAIAAPGTVRWLIEYIQVV